METEKPAKPKRSTAKSTPKRTAATTSTTRRRAVPQPAPAPVPAPVVPAAGSRLVIRLVQFLALVAAAGAMVFVLVGGENEAAPIAADVARIVSEGELTAFAAARETEIFWAGPIASRALEVRATRDGAFLRYLEPGTPAGTAEPTLTIATYPLPSAFATASAQADDEGMTSRTLEDGGIAVWSRERPTSVYVAARGIPFLVEVYSPSAAEARSVALSGRVGPVR